MEVGPLVVHVIIIGPFGLVRHYIKSLNLICVVRIDTKKKSTQEDSLHKREIMSGFFKACLEGSNGSSSDWYFVGCFKGSSKGLVFNGWIFYCLGFSEADHQSSSVVLSWVFGKSEGWIFSDWAETLQRCYWLVHLGFVRWD